MSMVVIRSFTCNISGSCFVHQTNVEYNGLVRMFESRPATAEGICVCLEVNINTVRKLKQKS